MTLALGAPNNSLVNNPLVPENQPLIDVTGLGIVRESCLQTGGELGPFRGSGSRA